MDLSHILDKKGSSFQRIAPDQPLTDAVALMMEHRIGSLLVMEGERLVSIVTERDVMRAVHENDGQLAGVPVRAVMSPRLVTCTRDTGVDELMERMMQNETGHRIRHLPVLEGHTPVGVVSIGDVIEALLTETRFENRLLKNYIKNWPEE